ncbi:hypothetical protein DPEC_G00050890 [Dallia pectoralis]|uniref:Uncharacterized protein n=1 Tax=Dallia pectoralis TaxID=75939 RepID=A0ACC2HCJ3_DALPE|nr:hypothetical protein DPEC_G00050890 [Dallia pectoralis]
MFTFGEKTLVIFYILTQMLAHVLAQVCPTRCRCPREPPMCAPRVPLILDNCACCLVCAKQKGQMCSEMNPCDARKVLNCDYTTDVHKRAGICVAHEGDICVLDGSVYQNGETFFPSCQYQCTCTDGQIGCVPRCNLDLMLPGPDCPFPRKVEVPGECCEKWVCEPQAEAGALGPVLAAYRQEETVGFDLWDPSINCIEQSTEWGACSRSCGTGISTRVSNKNRRCEMARQTRLCIVRPCDKQQLLLTEAQKRGGKCLRMMKTVEPIHFSYKNCTSVQNFRPRYCGVCTDGRCCTPHSTRTVQVEFRCSRGKAVKKPVMFINTCACHSHCPRDNALYQQSDVVHSGYRL